MIKSGAIIITALLIASGCFYSMQVFADDSASSATSSSTFRPPKLNPLVGQTQATLPAGTDMRNIRDFTSNDANICAKTGETRDNCFVQLIARVDDDAPRNTLACPIGYTTVFQFGTEVRNLDPKGPPKLVYAASDTHDPVNMDQRAFYLAYGYTCQNNDGPDQCFNTGVFDVSAGWDYGANCQMDSADDNKGFTGFAVGSMYQSVPTVGSKYPANVKGNPININGYPTSITKINMTHYACRLGGGGTGDVGSCNICVAGTYWNYAFDICGRWQKCSRDKGFHPIVQNGTYAGTNSYPLATRSDNPFTPTIMICGKHKKIWDKSSH